MVSVTELRAGAVFKDNGDPLQVVKYIHKKLGRGKANVRIRAKSLRTGTTVEKVFNSGAKVEEAEVVKKSVQFLYQDGKQLYFTDSETGDKVFLPCRQAGLPMKEQGNFLSKTQEVKLLVFEGEPLSVELPSTAELKVKKTEPGVKGNSATNIYKPATLESGHKLQVPLFVNGGDRIKVNTETGKYISRV